MTESGLSAGDVAIRQRIKELSVRIPCGELRGPEPRWRWQSCRCEDTPEIWVGADVSRARDLCIVCFRDTAGGPSRWSWLACQHCRQVSTAIERQSGERPFNLGWHSLMNGIGVRGGVPTEVRDQQIANLVAIARGDGRLTTWRDQEYSRLAAAFDPLAALPLTTWQEQWAPGLGASWDAFSRLLGFCLPLVKTGGE